MLIKSGRSKLNICNLFYGEKIEGTPRLLLRTSTFGLLIITVAIMLIRGKIIGTYGIDTLLLSFYVSSVLGLAISIISLIGFDEFKKTDNLGWRVWWRVTLFHLIIFSTTSYIRATFSNTSEISEPVTSMQFVETDLEKCKNSIKMKSKSFNYTYCSDDFRAYYDKQKNKNIQANLIGYVSYGTQKVDHVEFIARELNIIRK